MTEQFNTTAQCGLGVNSQMVSIQQQNDFKIADGFSLCICLREKFEFFANELYAFSVRTIHGHDVGFYFGFILRVNTLYEIANQG